MASLLHLSNELIIIIASNLSKPAHILHLALVNKRIHGIAIHHLYEDVNFDQDDYSLFHFSLHDCNTGGVPSTLDRNTSTDPHSNMLRLSKMIRGNTLPAGCSITRLTFVIGICNVYMKFQTFSSLLLPLFSSLKDLTVVSVFENRPSEHEYFSLIPLAAVLNQTSQTLQSLSMRFSQSPEDCDGWTIGSLGHFSKLKYLSLQREVSLKDKYGLPASSMLSLTSILPPGLRCLRLHRCGIKEIQSLRSLLGCFELRSWRVLSRTEKFAVHLNVETTNQIHQLTGKSLEASIPALNVEAGQGGLDLEMALEWREYYHWRQKSSPPKKALLSLLHEEMQKLDGTDLGKL